MTPAERCVIDASHIAVELVTRELAGIPHDQTAGYTEIALAGITANTVRLFADRLRVDPRALWEQIAMAYAEVGAEWEATR